MADELFQALMKRLPPTPEGVYPRPATDTPAIERAIAEVGRHRPDVRTMSIRNMEFMDPLAFSNVLGATDPTGHIRMNPSDVMQFRRIIENTVAHEAEHAREFRQKGRVPATSLSPDYWNHPSEVRARAAATQYGRETDLPSEILPAGSAKFPQPLILDLLKRAKD